jgi:hypothetical protein
MGVVSCGEVVEVKSVASSRWVVLAVTCKFQRAGPFPARGNLGLPPRDPPARYLTAACALLGSSPGSGILPWGQSEVAPAGQWSRFRGLRIVHFQPA